MLLEQEGSVRAEIRYWEQTTMRFAYDASVRGSINAYRPIKICVCPIVVFLGIGFTSNLRKTVGS